MNPETEIFVARKELGQAAEDFGKINGETFARINDLIDRNLKAGIKLVEAADRVAKLLK